MYTHWKCVKKYAAHTHTPAPYHTNHSGVSMAAIKVSQSVVGRCFLRFHTKRKFTSMSKTKWVKVLALLLETNISSAFNTSDINSRMSPSYEKHEWYFFIQQSCLNQLTDRKTTTLSRTSSLLLLISTWLKLKEFPIKNEFPFTVTLTPPCAKSQRFAFI